MGNKPCRKCKTSLLTEYNFCPECGSKTMTKRNINIYIIFVMSLFLYSLTSNIKENENYEYANSVKALSNQTQEVLPIIEEKEIKEIIAFNNIDYAIPVGFNEKIIDNTLALVDEESEFYCLVDIININFNSLQENKEEAVNSFINAGLEIGQTNTIYENNITWNTYELIERNNKYLALYTKYGIDKTILIIVKREDNKIDYNILKRLTPFVVKLKQSI